MSIPELFESAPFLETKLGTQIFEEIPQNPGIYRFYDEMETLLYVGKAKNLRRRLFTYKRARPGRTSRKEAALISRICRFEYDVLESEQEAILEENRWIREHRPEFNHANKHTETYYFVTIQETSSGLWFGLSMNSTGRLFPSADKPLYREFMPLHPEVKETKIYGCFKGHRAVRTSFGALLRLLWMAEYPSASPHFLPVQLSRNLTPLRFHLALKNQSVKKDEFMHLLDQWFLGISPELLDQINEMIGKMSNHYFTRIFLDENRELLLNYFQKYLQRHRIMRESVSGRLTHLIQQEELDDLIAKLDSKARLGGRVDPSQIKKPELDC